MADFVVTSMVNFTTATRLRSINSIKYDDNKFESDYAHNPNRMSPSQIAMNGGYDSLKAHLWREYSREKYDSLYEMEIAEANKVIEQIKPYIKLNNKTELEVIEGKINPYSEPHLRLPRIELSNKKGNEYLMIEPTLTDKDENYFYIKYRTDYADEDRYCSDVELICEINNFCQYLIDGVKPTIGIYKLRHKYDNQYEVQFGNHTIGLYDIEFVMLYHCLAKEMNSKFGTNYKYSQDVIDKLFKKSVYGNIQYVGTFFLRETWGGTYELMYREYFEDDKTRKPTFDSLCNYGYYKLEDIKAILDILEPCCTTNYFADHISKYIYGNCTWYDEIKS